METGEKRVIGGRLAEVFEGELKLVFQNGILQRNHEHRHSCGGKVVLIIMEASINAGAILACENCHWRTSFDPELLTTDRRDELMRKIFLMDRNSQITFFCVDCMKKPINDNEEKCAGCLAKEAIHIDLPDDLKK